MVNGRSNTALRSLGETPRSRARFIYRRPEASAPDIMVNRKCDAALDRSKRRLGTLVVDVGAKFRHINGMAAYDETAGRPNMVGDGQVRVSSGRANA